MIGGAAAAVGARPPWTPLTMSPSLVLAGDDPQLSFAGFTWPNPGSAADFTEGTNKPTSTTAPNGRQGVDSDGTKLATGPACTALATVSAWWLSFVFRLDTNRTSATVKNWTACPIITDDSGNWGIFAYWNGSAMIIFAYQFTSAGVKVTPDVTLSTGGIHYCEASYDGSTLHFRLDGGADQTIAALNCSTLAASAKLFKGALSAQGWDGAIFEGGGLASAAPSAAALTFWRSRQRERWGVTTP